MQQEVKYLSLQSQYLFLNAFSNYNNCPMLETTLRSTIQDLSTSLSEVVAFEENNGNNEYTLRQKVILRRYTLDNLRYWLLAKESKQKCNLDVVPILYFYTPDCPSCPNQGTILTYFKDLFGEKVLVFPINLELRTEEPLVEVMMSQFNIDEYPTLIVDNVKYEGVVKKEQLQEIICNSLHNSAPCLTLSLNSTS
jgi:hypothetical protein